MRAKVEKVDVDTETVEPNEVSPMEEENDKNRNSEILSCNLQVSSPSEFWEMSDKIKLQCIFLQKSH